MKGCRRTGVWRADRLGSVAVPTVVGGITFRSKLEASHYQMLKLRETAGEISDLKRQVRFKLVVNGSLIRTYVMDFTFIEEGQQVAWESKGYRTEIFELKEKLFRALYPDWQLVVMGR